MVAVPRVVRFIVRLLAFDCGELVKHIVLYAVGVNCWRNILRNVFLALGCIAPPAWENVIAERCLGS
jgi:hypothetical protein